MTNDIFTEKYLAKHEYLRNLISFQSVTLLVYYIHHSSFIIHQEALHGASQIFQTSIHHSTEYRFGNVGI